MKVGDGVEESARQSCARFVGRFERSGVDGFSGTQGPLWGGQSDVEHDAEPTVTLTDSPGVWCHKKTVADPEPSVP